MVVCLGACVKTKGKTTVGHLLERVKVLGDKQQLGDALRGDLCLGRAQRLLETVDDCCALPRDTLACVCVCVCVCECVCVCINM